MSKAREIVLRLVSEGKITVEEAEELLNAVEGGAKEPFANFFSGKETEPGHRHTGAREQARAHAAKTREAARAGRGSRGGGFEFNFPWDQEGWQWPWEHEDWQWPWEQEGWQWGQAAAAEEEAVSTVEVPEEAQLNIKVSGGDLAIQGNGEAASLRLVVPGAPSKITAEDGVIHISSAGEDVAIEVPTNVASIGLVRSGGDAAITKLEADMIAKVSGGDMVVSEFTGKIQASVEGGDATLVHINSTSVEVRTEGGDTDLSMASPIEEGSIILSGNDDISLALSPDSKCEISVAAADGDIEHSLPPEALEIIEENDNYLNAKLNGGGAEITLSASSGDVSVRTV